VILTAIRISFYLEAVDLPDRADLAAAVLSLNPLIETLSLSS
jgi:hypothetical protein